MKIKLQIKNRFTGSILFEFEKENNTIRDTVIEAVRNKADLSSADLRGAYLSSADLSSADLRGANLRGADLRGAYLSSADLSGADLSGADLRGAYLSSADLRGAYLRGAYLSSADLRGADLRGAYLRGKKIKAAAVFTGLYQYIVIPYITEENELRIKMGCYDRSLSEWEENFWNNDNEFPNNNSMKSNLRLMAYNTAKAWIGLNKADALINALNEKP